MPMSHLIMSALNPVFDTGLARLPLFIQIRVRSQHMSKFLDKQEIGMQHHVHQMIEDFRTLVWVGVV